MLCPLLDLLGSHVMGAAAICTACETPSPGLLHLGLTKGRADLPGGLHGSPDGLIVRVCVEEQHHLAGGTLPRIAALQPAGAFAEYAPATAAANLNGIIEHQNPPTLLAPSPGWRGAVALTSQCRETSSV